MQIHIQRSIRVQKSQHLMQLDDHNTPPENATIVPLQFLKSIHPMFEHIPHFSNKFDLIRIQFIFNNIQNCICCQHKIYKLVR
uniref:Uncharacterized protein n=1 Tax=Rhizophora mucronata TaxID=61149 RepID=A0A2P2N401_RHIMU